jgi:hypothetical protein
VLNARAGVKLAELTKAGMKVVAIFSKGKNLYEGPLKDSKTEVVWEEETKSDEEENEPKA